MRLARVVGRVWSTVKDPLLDGKKLLVIQPIDADGSDRGAPLVALDAVGAGAGETVYWSGRREACFAFDPQAPTDAGVTGIVDNIARGES